MALLMVYLLRGVGGWWWPGLGWVLGGGISILRRFRGEQDGTPSQRRASVLQISKKGIWRGEWEKKLNMREREK